MKGYNFQGELLKKNFIERYEIKKGKIYLYMASGEKLEYNYSEDLLHAIEKSQEESYNKNINRQIRKNKEMTGTFNALAILFGGLSLVALIPFILSGAMASLIISFILVSVAVYGEIRSFSLQKSLEELEKQGFYLENKELFKDSIVDNKNITQCLSKSKTKDMKSQIEKTGSAFNLSSIDKVSLAQLKELKDNIEREQRFQELSSKENSKVKTKEFKMFSIK